MSATAARPRPSAARGGPWPPRWKRPALVVAAVALALSALYIARHAGVRSAAAVPETARAVAALLALLVAAGYAPARLLVPRSMYGHFVLIVPLVGAAVAGLVLTALGFAAVPFPVSLAVVLGAGTLAALLVRARRGPVRPDGEGPDRTEGRALRLFAPAYLAALVVAVALVPVYVFELAGVQGINPDALLGVGVAELLQDERPAAIEPSQPVDRVPLVWRSKYPIYYVLAGAASLSGLEPIAVFAAVTAVLLALTAVAFFLLARYGLRAGPAGALLAMAFVALNQGVAHLALHPYYNQLWGTLALPLILLFGLRWLERPNRRDGALLGLFAAVGLAAYPLMALFPALALAAAAVAVRRRGGLRLPRPARPRGWRLALWSLAAVLTLPALLFLALGVAEKAVSALDVLISGESLAVWRGDLRVFLDAGFFVGVPGAAGAAVAIGVLAAATLSLRRMPSAMAAALAAATAGGLAFAFYFRLREFGEYFYFKLLAFTAPLLLVMAAVWLARRARERHGSGAAAWAVAALLCVLMTFGLRDLVAGTILQTDEATLELRQAGELLPVDASIRIDAIGGRALWAAYMLHERPLSSTTPLTGATYPHVPYGRKADYVLTDRRAGVDPGPDATGPAVFDNGQFRIHRMSEDVPGPDRSSRRQIDGFSSSFD